LGEVAAICRFEAADYILAVCPDDGAGMGEQT